MPTGEQVLRQLLETDAPVMLSLHDVEGRYVSASDQARQLQGREPRELVGRDAYELQHPDDRAAVQIGHVTLVATTQVVLVDYRLRHADGHYVPVRSIAWSDRAPDSTPTQLVVLTIPRDDLTEADTAALHEVSAATARRVAGDVLPPSEPKI